MLVKLDDTNFVIIQQISKVHHVLAMLQVSKALFFKKLIWKTKSGSDMCCD